MPRAGKPRAAELVLTTRLSIAWAVAAVLVACGGSPGAGQRDASTDADANIGVAVLGLTDISAESPDLAASVYGGAPGWDHSDKYAPGVALVDLDGDGELDLVQPRNDRADPALRSLRIYRGAGDGTFADVTSVLWDDRRNATVVLAFDYDGDDDLDLFVGVDRGPSVLYRNDGAFAFTDVAAAAGVDLPGVRVFAAVAGDVDADGDLDLYIGTWNADAPDHGPGTAPNRLLINGGDGTFTDGTATARVACDGRSTLGAAFADFDDDGDLDLYVANDFFDACLYENQGDGTFADVATDAGVLSGAWNGMGVAVADLDGDGDLDLVVTDDEVQDASRGNAVYLNRGEPSLAFDSRGIELGLDGVATLQADWLVCWGVGLVDLDLDGDVDVHIATHGERSELVWQQRGGEFVADYDLMSSLVDVDGRGSVYGDIDGDGDIDIVVARRGAGLQVLRNDTVGGHWLTIAPRPLSAAPGARIVVRAGGRRQVAVVHAGDSYMSTNPPTVTFGVGDATIIDQVEVRFVSGLTRTLTDLDVGQVVVVEQP